MNLDRRLGAEDAGLAIVPVRQNVTHLTILLQHLNLQHARLPTILGLGPVRATLQPQIRRIGDCAQRRMRQVYVDGGGPARLRASDQSLAAITHKRADDWRSYEIENCEDGDGDDQISSD